VRTGGQDSRSKTGEEVEGHRGRRKEGEEEGRALL